MKPTMSAKRMLRGAMVSRSAQRVCPGTSLPRSPFALGHPRQRKGWFGMWLKMMLCKPGLKQKGAPILGLAGGCSLSHFALAPNHPNF